MGILVDGFSSVGQVDVELRREAQTRRLLARALDFVTPELADVCEPGPGGQRLDKLLDARLRLMKIEAMRAENAEAIRKVSGATRVQ